MTLQTLLNLAQLTLGLAMIALMFAASSRLRWLRKRAPGPHPDPTSGFRDPCRQDATGAPAESSRRGATHLRQITRSESQIGWK